MRLFQRKEKPAQVRHILPADHELSAIESDVLRMAGEGKVLITPHEFTEAHQVICTTGLLHDVDKILYCLKGGRDAEGVPVDVKAYRMFSWLAQDSTDGVHQRLTHAVDTLLPFAEKVLDDPGNARLREGLSQMVNGMFVDARVKRNK